MSSLHSIKLPQIALKVASFSLIRESPRRTFAFRSCPFLSLLRTESMLGFEGVEPDYVCYLLALRPLKNRAIFEPTIEMGSPENLFTGISERLLHILRVAENRNT